MRVNGLDHVNIRTEDISVAIRFYSELLGLTAGDVAAKLPPEKAQWLHDHNGKAIIHLFSAEGGKLGSTGPIHHIALNCSGKDEVLARLRARKAEFKVNEMAAMKLTQIFTKDPYGILLELNFIGE